TFSLVAQTVKFIKVSSLCLEVGFITNSPSTKPTITAPTGSVYGILEIHNAKEAALIAKISGKLSFSTDITVQTTCTSFLYPLGNKGLKGLSIALPFNIA